MQNNLFNKIKKIKKKNRIKSKEIFNCSIKIFFPKKFHLKW